MTTTADPVERDSTPTSVLTDEMLARFDERAPIYDRENRFFDEDFAELQASGFLDVAIPTELGGGGIRLDEYSRLLRRLGYHAPATALAVNMHVYWTGVAADLLAPATTPAASSSTAPPPATCSAALHGEAGNDMPLLLSTASATRTDGGWLISGHKIFGSLTPVWTLGGFHAMDSSDPAAPKIVHGFVPRETAGLQIVETWDTLGMRATQSQDTVLDEAFVPDELIALVCPAGFGGAGLFHVSIFAWALLGFASIYLGAAKRAYDITLDHMPRRTSLALTNSMAHHPEVQHHVAEMRMAYDVAEALLERTVSDWAGGAEHADWPVRIIGTRQTVINNAFDMVDRALDLSGGAGAFKRSRIEQLFRDVRMGRFHPGNTFLAHELIAKLSLGLDPDAPSAGADPMRRTTMRMTMRITRIVAVAAAVLAASVTPAGAEATRGSPVVRPLATFGSGYASGSTVGPDGALYVTDPNAGAVLRVDRRTGAVTTFARGLPPKVLDIGGAMDVAFVGRTAYVLVTLVGGDVIGGPHIGDATVGIYRLGATAASRRSPTSVRGRSPTHRPPPTSSPPACSTPCTGTRRRSATAAGRAPARRATRPSPRAPPGRSRCSARCAGWGPRRGAAPARSRACPRRSGTAPLWPPAAARSASSTASAPAAGRGWRACRPSPRG